MKSIHFMGAVLLAATTLSATAATKVWTGLGADAKASTAANWQADGGADPTAPVAGDAIVLDVTGRDYPMTWDLDIPLASWTQDGYTNVVTIQTVYPNVGKGNFTNLVVAGDVTLRSGIWTHAANRPANKEEYRLAARVGGNLVVGANAALSADAKGFGNAGWGRMTISGGAYSPAHGGRGTLQYPTHTTRCYGSIREPVRIGSSCNDGQLAGGAILLAVAGEAVLDGRVSANGLTRNASGGINAWYAPTGGSVWITAGSVSGAATGLVSADGGWCANGYYGGGGRVSICLTDSAADFSGFLGTVQAVSAKKNGTAISGAPGTVYYETAADGYGRGRLVVDAKNSSADREYYMTDLYFSDQVPGFNPRVIEIRDKGRLAIMDAGTLSPTGVVLSVQGDIVVQGAATLDFSAAQMHGDGSACGIRFQHASTFIPPANLVLDGCGIALSASDVDFRSPNALVLTNGATLTLSVPLELATAETIVAGSTLTASAGLSLAGNLHLLSGGVVTHASNTYEGLNKLDLTVGGALTIDAGGKIDAYEKGFPAKCGLGSGTAGNSGAAHGGRGVYSGTGAVGAGICYGSVTRPTDLGSGSPGGSNSRPGGGAIKVTVVGAVTNNGVISANGSSNTTSTSSPGGSVWLTAASLAGSGTFSANAYGDKARNDKTSVNNNSGGGRVAVWLTDPAADFSNFSGLFSAWGSGNGNYLGGAGTVYLKTGAQAADEGTLVIENRYVASKGVGYTEIGSEVTDAAVGRVEIKAGAKLRVIDGQSLTVNGDFVNEGVFSAENGGTLILAGTAPAAVSGNTITVDGLICEAPGKTVTFADGFSIAVNALLNLAGENGSPLIIRASEGVTPWALTLASAAEQSVGFVAVSDSDASAGEEIVAINSTGSNTQNWRFVSAQPGDVLTWTGASSSGWALPANWDAGRAPIPTDVIVVPSGRPHNPVLSSSVAVAQLTIAQGASLNLDGNDLAVTGDLAVSGLITATASETIAVAGNCSLAAGGLAAASSTLRLDGASAQTAALGGNRLNNLVLANSSPDGIVFTQDFTAGNLVCAPTDATALRFASGVTTSVSVGLTLTGASAEAPLTLAPQTAGSWNLRSLGFADISCCAVSGSTASGNALVATDSTDGGNNVNWFFGDASTCTWTGNVSADFADAGNWAEGSAPGAGDAVIFDGARPMTISAPATIRSLVVGGSGAPTLTVNAPLSVSDAVVAKADATIVANRKVTVGGSLITENGAAITHAANSGSAIANHIDIEVGGDLVLPAGASISATGKGYAGDNTTNGGPGYQGSSGGSHGGRGGSHNNNGQRACYGSIYCPTNFGSARSSGLVGGGGAVRLVVGGELSLNGTVDADGGENDGVATASIYYGTSGGSVWITATHLSGTGKISASGGAIKENYMGAGGRVAIYLTGDRTLSFGGSVEAYAGSKSADVPPYPKGAPGTIYIETTSDAARCGRVIVANASTGVANGGQNSQPLVDYPVTTWAGKDDGRWATWELSNDATLNVTADARIADVWLEGSKPQIKLNGHTLRIGTREHALGTSASQVVVGGTAENPGQIIWQQPATILFLK